MHTAQTAASCLNKADVNGSRARRLAETACHKCRATGFIPDYSNINNAGDPGRKKCDACSQITEEEFHAFCDSAKCQWCRGTGTYWFDQETGVIPCDQCAQSIQNDRGYQRRFPDLEQMRQDQMEAFH